MAIAWAWTNARMMGHRWGMDGMAAAMGVVYVSGIFILPCLSTVVCPIKLGP
jgi:hypothetical protein